MRTFLPFLALASLFAACGGESNSKTMICGYENNAPVYCDSNGNRTCSPDGTSNGNQDCSTENIQPTPEPEEEGEGMEEAA